MPIKVTVFGQTCTTHSIHFISKSSNVTISYLASVLKCSAKCRQFSVFIVFIVNDLRNDECLLNNLM